MAPRDGGRSAFSTNVPLALRWAAGAIIVLAGVPFAYGWWRPLGKIAIPWWAALPVALAAFWIFREQTWHGDALYKVDLLATQPLQTNPYVWKEPLDSLLEYAVSGLVQPVGLGPDVAIALMSVAAGGVFVLATWAAAAWLAASALRRLVIYTALLAGGTSLLWFGHIENYSWSTAMAFATLALAVGYLAERTPLWAVAVAGGAAVSFHPQAAFVLPALLVLLRRDRWPRQVVILVLGGLVVPLLTVGVFLWLKVPPPGLNGGFAGDPQLFWTPMQALAPAQLAEALQNLWLIAPLWPLWIGAGVWGVAQPELRRDRTFVLLAVAAAGMLFYFFTFQNDLARQRDWDLFAIAGPPLALWGVYTWLRLLEMAPSLRVAATLRQTLAAALVFAAAFTLFWIGVNHAYTIVRPNSAERDLYARYRLLDLADLLPQAAVTPDAPICAEPSGCERVALTEFTMPQTGDTAARHLRPRACRDRHTADRTRRARLPLAQPGARSAGLGLGWRWCDLRRQGAQRCRRARRLWSQTSRRPIPPIGIGSRHSCRSTTTGAERSAGTGHRSGPGGRRCRRPGGLGHAVADARNGGAVDSRESLTSLGVVMATQVRAFADQRTSSRSTTA